MNLIKFAKLAQVIQSRRLTRALLYDRVLAGVEHRFVLSRNLRSVIDIGANRGQFALAVRKWAPDARVISFEPLPAAASDFRRVFNNDDRVVLHQAAIGPAVEVRKMHLSRRDDSSSLLPISSLQKSTFPGTDEVGTLDVRVGPLQEFVRADDLQQPAMLKLDVQGFEYEALMGCLPLLQYFQWVYCECSFIELYIGQKHIPKIIELLAGQGFSLHDLHNPVYNSQGRCIQVDMLFARAAA